MKRIICFFRGHVIVRGWWGEHCYRCKKYFPPLMPEAKIGDTINIKMPQRFRPGDKE